MKKENINAVSFCFISTYIMGSFKDRMMIQLNNRFHELCSKIGNFDTIIHNHVHCILPIEKRTGPFK